MPAEMVFATILISFITCITCMLAGGTLIFMILRYAEYIKQKTKYDLPAKIVNRGLMLGGLSIASGLFFAYRIFYVMANNADFPPKDWLLFDGAVGIYMYLTSSFLLTLYKQRVEIDALPPVEISTDMTP